VAGMAVTCLQIIVEALITIHEASGNWSNY